MLNERQHCCATLLEHSWWSVNAVLIWGFASQSSCVPASQFLYCLKKKFKQSDNSTKVNVKIDCVKFTCPKMFF